MAAMHGFMDGSYDYKQMYTIQDLRGPLPTPVIQRSFTTTIADIPRPSLQSLSSLSSSPTLPTLPFAKTNNKTVKKNDDIIRGF